MNAVQKHYEILLGPNYTWMVGVPFEEKQVEQYRLLVKMGLFKGDWGLAIDLGSGAGYQTAALLNLGYYEVLAIDFNSGLLNELQSNLEGRRIKPIHDDLRNFRRHLVPSRPEVVTCMGDTLTHLESKEDVSKLFSEVYDVLLPSGSFILTFRDLSEELTGLDRFRPIQRDSDRILTCFLEYFPDKVMVHDLLQFRSGNCWTLLKSSYPKLRLSPACLEEELRQIGFEIGTNHKIDRLWCITAIKP